MNFSKIYVYNSKLFVYLQVFIVLWKKKQQMMKECMRKIYGTSFSQDHWKKKQWGQNKILVKNVFFVKQIHENSCFKKAL